MALIKCPECGKEVSDKANICPNCGLGIRESIDEETRKKIEIQQQVIAKAKQQVILEREQLIENVKLPDKPSKTNSIIAGVICAIMALVGLILFFIYLEFVWLLITILFSIIALYAPKSYKDDLNKYEQAIKNTDEYKRSVIEEQERETTTAIENAKTAPKCPKCGSTYISTINRGYSIIWGFIGSGKAMNVCQKCGHKWKPGS